MPAQNSPRFASLGTARRTRRCPVLGLHDDDGASTSARAQSDSRGHRGRAGDLAHLFAPTTVLRLDDDSTPANIAGHKVAQSCATQGLTYAGFPTSMIRLPANVATAQQVFESQNDAVGTRAVVVARHGDSEAAARPDQTPP